MPEIETYGLAVSLWALGAGVVRTSSGDRMWRDITYYEYILYEYVSLRLSAAVACIPTFKMAIRRYVPTSCYVALRRLEWLRGSRGDGARCMCPLRGLYHPSARGLSRTGALPTWQRRTVPLVHRHGGEDAPFTAQARPPLLRLRVGLGESLSGAPAAMGEEHADAVSAASLLLGPPTSGIGGAHSSQSPEAMAMLRAAVQAAQAVGIDPTMALAHMPLLPSMMSGAAAAASAAPPRR